MVGRTLHNLDELGVAYAVLIDGIPRMFSNVKPLHAAAIVERQYLLNVKIEEYKIEADAERITAIPQSGSADV